MARARKFGSFSGMEGAFIATGDYFLPDHAELDLAFNVQATGGVPQRVTAQVVRCTGAGVGVRLECSTSNSLHHMVEALYAVRPA